MKEVMRRILTMSYEVVEHHLINVDDESDVKIKRHDESKSDDCSYCEEDE